MSKRLTGYVHVPKDGTFITLAPGDILPDWAVDIVTNPDVLEDADGASAASNGTVADANPGASDTPKPDRSDATARAKTLGVKANGKTEDILARIAEKEAELAAAHTTDVAPDRATLETAAKELDIEFNADTTDVELAALIAAKE